MNARKTYLWEHLLFYFTSAFCFIHALMLELNDVWTIFSLSNVQINGWRMKKMFISNVLNADV